MNAGRIDWYLKRLRAMSVGEVLWRARDKAVQASWQRRQVAPGRSPSSSERSILRTGKALGATLPSDVAARIPDNVRESLVREADEILEGHLRILGVERSDLRKPDWFFDPITERRAPADTFAFKIEHRSEAVTGNVKQVWELSRLQHLTLLAAAWNVTREDAYAQAVDAQLRSWWEENPFLTGVNWTSGIEVGIRLISFTWIRRLLDGWDGAALLFENNDAAVSQVHWHQEYLATFRSRGSSANNHVLAEAAGQLVASCGLPWFDESDRWRKGAAALLERELLANTFPSGLNREQASEYHGFVAELGLIAALEADACGQPLRPRTWDLLAQVMDAAVAVTDSSLAPPRQGDGDSGRALVLDAHRDHYEIVLSVGAELVGPKQWWPRIAPSAESVFLGSLCERSAPARRGRLASRPSHFADAGLTLLRTDPGDEPEIWCRCDGGPHGFLSIAGHAHADALSVELRYGGTEILADPGTYCYHGEPEMRKYFRSTLAHNTVRIAQRNQSTEGGPFLWLTHAKTSDVELQHRESGAISTWSASHDGYQSLDAPAHHKRTVRLDLIERSVSIEDVITTEGTHDLEMAFHLGPDVSCRIEGRTALLDWPSREDRAGGRAAVELPDHLEWAVHNGERDPILGWYSPSFGSIEPTNVLLGKGLSRRGTTRLSTSLTFTEEPRRNKVHG